MTATVQLVTIDALGAEIYVSFNSPLTGSYVTGGDPCNFTGSGTAPAIQDPTYIGLAAVVESSQLLQFDIWTQGGNIINQIVANKVSTSPVSGGKIKIGAASSFATEFTAGAYSAGLLADTITGFAIFTKML